jgi:hypothetical protein
LEDLHSSEDVAAKVTPPKQLHFFVPACRVHFCAPVANSVFPKSEPAPIEKLRLAPYAISSQ